MSLGRSLGCVVSCLALWACAQKGVAPEPAGERRVAYLCANGESVELRILPNQEGADLVRQGRPIRLAQQSAGSGFAYGNGPITVRGKGAEMTIEVGRMVPIVCEVPGGTSTAPWRYGP